MKVLNTLKYKCEQLEASMRETRSVQENLDKLRKNPLLAPTGYLLKVDESIDELCTKLQRSRLLLSQSMEKAKGLEEKLKQWRETAQSIKIVGTSPKLDMKSGAQLAELTSELARLRSAFELLKAGRPPDTPKLNPEEMIPDLMSIQTFLKQNPAIETVNSSYNKVISDAVKLSSLAKVVCNCLLSVMEGGDSGNFNTKQRKKKSKKSKQIVPQKSPVNVFGASNAADLVTSAAGVWARNNEKVEVKKSPRVSEVSSDDVDFALFECITDMRNRQLNHRSSSSLTCSPYRQQPRGFINTQNTCYFIACLQSLFSIPAFVAILDRLSATVHSVFAEVGCLRNLWTEDLAVTTPILRLFVLLLDDISPYKPNQPNGGQLALPNDFGYIPTGKPLKVDPKFFSLLTLEVGHEQDAADCMSRLITQLHEEMACLLRRFKPSETPKNALEEDDDGEEWTTVGCQGKKFTEARQTQVDNGEMTPISFLFGGNLISRSSYKKASRTANKSDISVKERFFVLPLELNDPQVTSLEDGFRLLAKRDILSDFRDPETGACVVMNRRVFIDHLPPVILVQLNRFFYSVSKNGIQKVLKQIPVYKQLQIPDSIVSKERAFSKAQGTYELTSVVFHIGYNATRGHYTTVTLPTQDDLLYFDDERVFRLHQQRDEESMLRTHRPFDGRNCRFTECRHPAGSDGPRPSIAEQPRTPYLLVYTSRFQS
ncbi:unnamed protein product [Mesocestoides corti]|uniref:ubiquitinyl hydrolase 1 n=2 Tax=Mesocestoides corti TaxID=53468 RepID=A0A0R3UPF9_MESCO|nr:unnamed protein product [Mesocestoides corti]